jgi:hypothetical protein
VAWSVSLVARDFPYLGIRATGNPLVLGLTALGAFNTAARDGLNTPSPVASAQYAAPHGTVQLLCVANGVYGIEAVQGGEPHRAGQFIVRAPPDCPRTVRGLSADRPWTDRPRARPAHAPRML